MRLGPPGWTGLRESHGVQRPVSHMECEAGHGPGSGDEAWGPSLGVQTTGLVRVSVAVHGRAESPEKGGKEKSASLLSEASERLV